MRPLLAVVLLAVLGVSIAEGEDDPPGANLTLPPEKDYRLAKLTDAQTQRIGILTYYPNKGGGYTFMEGKQVEFYSLPYVPTTYRRSARNANGNWGFPGQKSDKVSIIGTREMPFGGQTVYRSHMEGVDRSGLPRRVDTPIAKWTRDTADGQFRLSIMVDDRETRLKLKSIIGVLERAPKPLPSKP